VGASLERPRNLVAEHGGRYLATAAQPVPGELLARAQPQRMGHPEWAADQSALLGLRPQPAADDVHVMPILLTEARLGRQQDLIGQVAVEQPSQLGVLLHPRQLRVHHVPYALLGVAAAAQHTQHDLLGTRHAVNQ